MRAALLRYRRLPRGVHLGVVLVAVLLVLSPEFSSIGRSAPSSDRLVATGFSGVAGTPVVPAAKVTLVAFDNASLKDDLAYLAAVPASTFWSAAAGAQVQSPLLFYQPPMVDPSAAETALDAGKGVDYFMDDYVTACGGSLAELQTIGLDAAKAGELQRKWSAASLVALPADCAVTTAARIAKANWEWSDAAVVAVVEPDVAAVSQHTEGKLSGTVPSVEPQHGKFTGSISPSFHSQNEYSFNVGDRYRYIEGVLDWGTPYPLPSFTQKGKELGFELYSGDIMVALSTEWNALSTSTDTARSYVYWPGQWKAAVTYVPTSGLPTTDRTQPPGRADDSADYTLTYSLYGGVDVPLPDVPAAGTKEAKFTLTWSDASRDLGIFLRDPTGLEIDSSVARGTGGTQTLEVPELGGGAYTVSVVSLDDSLGAVDFDVDYSWNTTMSRDEIGALTGASEASVLASELGAPLLYATPKALPAETESALDLLGVHRVVLVDLAGKGDAALVRLEGMHAVGGPGIAVERIGSFESAVKRVVAQAKGYRERTQDVVFTTLDPWSYWLTGRSPEGPAGEEWGGRYIGPAAYAAASHACPLLPTEVDSRLSCAKSWHTVFWTEHTRAEVPVSAMYLTGTAVYDCLGSLGLDLTGQETIVTVADQFDIGTPWDRALVGPALPGRIQGTPVDASYQVCRGAMYPLMVFANPGVDQTLDPSSGVRMVGSTSQRVMGGLRITQPEQGVKMHAPVALTWACYLYKFNEVGSNYWGAKYVARDGSIPGESPSRHPFDKGVLPDLSEDVFAKYSAESGYGHAEAAGYKATIENLDRGCVMWIETMHGGNGGSGGVAWWSSTKPEPDPKRAYEEFQGLLMGSTEDPDVMALGKYTGQDYTPCTGPITSLDIIPERHDGEVIAYQQQSTQLMSVSGFDLDTDLTNLHSLGVYAGSCSIADTFLHLTLIRHGSVFQIIDPWLGSWYVQLGQEVFYRDVGYGDVSVGQAYEDAISLVGAEYVSQDWFWDVWENTVLYGEPDVRVYTPYAPILMPEVISQDAVLAGHSIMAARSHPAAITGSLVLLALAGAGVAVLVAEAYVLYAGRDRLHQPRMARRARPVKARP